MAEMNTNLYNNGGLVKQSEQRGVQINQKSVGRTLKKIVAPVFDFFTKEAEPEEKSIVDYEAEIQKYEMRSATTQRILNDSDPKSRTKMNIVI